MNSYEYENQNEPQTKATVFTDPFGNSQLKYDIILDDGIGVDSENVKINTLKYQHEALQLQQPKRQNTLNRQPLPRITVNNIQFLTRFSLIICIFFPLTGLPAVCFSQLMKTEFYNCNYEKAIQYKYYAKILSYLTVLFGILGFVTLMICIPILV